MKFYLDENFPKSAHEYLQSRGHETFDPRGTALEGADDEALVKEALRFEAVILTTDRDFFHTLRQQFPDHAGFGIIALKRPSREAILSRLAWFLEHVPVEHIHGRAFQLRDKHWAVIPPIPE